MSSPRFFDGMNFAPGPHRAQQWYCKPIIDMQTQIFLKGYKRDLTIERVKAGLIVHKEFVRTERPTKGEKNPELPKLPI